MDGWRTVFVSVEFSICHGQSLQSWMSGESGEFCGRTGAKMWENPDVFVKKTEKKTVIT